MGRGKRGFLDALAGLPWPVGLAVGALGFFVIGQGIPVWFARQGGPLSRAFAGAAQPFSLLAWVFVAMCALAAFASFRDAQRKRRLFDTRTGLDSIAALGWRDFERLVGEAFRRRGYVVEETGLGGADGGIDLILRRDGRRVLVQCKQWRRERVPVNVVREMYGLLGHHRADEVRIAALGGFTPDAERFAQGKPIELINGPALLEMSRGVQAGESERKIAERIEPRFEAAAGIPVEAPACPKCGMSMVQRINRRSGNRFWGCGNFPVCRGTL